MDPLASSGRCLRPIFIVFALLLSFLFAGQAGATMYDAELSEQTMRGPDLCADAPCRDVMPAAQEFSKRKGAPSYVDAFAVEGGTKRLVGYVFLSTDVVDIPAYSGKPVITLIGMDTGGIITGVRVLKHSEPILLAGIPESALLKFIDQYVGKKADSKLVIGRDQGDSDTVAIDAISGATVTVIAENQVISRSAYEIGKQVGLIKSVPKPPARFTELNEAPMDWAGLLKEGSVQHLVVPASSMGLADTSRPYMDLYFGYLNVPAIGTSLLGKHAYQRLMDDLKPDEHAIFIIGNGQETFKGSGYVRGGIYDRVQVRQDPVTFTFRDTDYMNLYSLQPADVPGYRESAIFIIRSPNFNPAWPWQLTVLANKPNAAGGKTFVHFDRESWLPGRYLEGGRPRVDRPEAVWKSVWKNQKLEIALFIGVLSITALLYALRDQLVRRSTRKHKPWTAVPHHLLWIASVLFLGFYLKAIPSITHVMTWFYSMINQWKWELFLSDPFIFIFWLFIVVTVLVWGRGVFCGWLCPFGSLQQLMHSAGERLGLKRFQRLLPKLLHDKLKWIKYGIFFALLAVSFYSMETAEKLAEIEPFKTTFIVGVWNRTWPFWLFIGGILTWSVFSERPYCKYLCPLGAGLAIPGKFPLFRLKRKAECQTCHACAAGCGSNAIDAAGKIDPMECMSCLDCMVLYYDDHACPPLVKERKSREKLGLALTPINAKGYFISLDSVRSSLSGKAAELADRNA